MKLILDNLDDRREVHRMLQVLDPREAVRWLRWCCQQVTRAGKLAPKPSIALLDRAVLASRFGGDRHYRLATEIYGDFWALVVQYGLDPVAATIQLEQVARASSRSAQLEALLGRP